MICQVADTITLPLCSLDCEV